LYQIIEEKSNLKIVTMKSQIFALAFVLLVSIGCGNSQQNQKIKSSAHAAMSITKNNEIMKKTGAFLEISLKVEESNRAAAAGVYVKYKEPFLKQIDGALSKELLIRAEDVQVLHGFASEAQANAYLSTSLFATDIVGELGPLLASDPEVRIYSVFDQ